MATFRDILLPLAVLLLGLAMLIPKASQMLAIAGTILAGVDVVLVLLAA
jgi:hypothetical protein